MKKGTFTLILFCFLLIFSSCARNEPAAATKKPIIILHTNDVHAGIDDNMGYAGLAAYKKEMEAAYGAENVVLVDAGDAIQGASVAMLTKGAAIVELMNAVGYDYVVPGNHEFDYQIPRYFELVKSMEAQVISANFVDLLNNKPVFSAYKMYTVNDVDIAFVGVTTPESLTKASVRYFQDEKGNFVYTFLEDETGQELYDGVQKVVNEARAEGADYVVAVVHLGIDEGSQPWRSTDLIANVEGLDVVLDGHSHSIVEGEVYKGKGGEEVVLSQTGTKLMYIGKIVIDPSKPDGEQIAAFLVGGGQGQWASGAMPSFTKKDPDVLAKVNEIKAKFAKILMEKIAHSAYDLVASGAEYALVRRQETNLGNFVADAYRTLLDTQVALTNGGSMRTDLEKGDITYQDIIDVHPFANHIVAAEVRGQVLKDALEMGAKSLPASDGGFLHVSGMTYEIDASIPSSVELDEYDNFVAVNGAYRVKNIRINGKSLDVHALYTVASHDFLLKKFGDGMAMFKDARITKDMFMLDSDVLIAYIEDHLKGVIGSQYANPAGSRRIVIHR